MEKANIVNINGEFMAERLDIFKDVRRFGDINKTPPLKYTKLSVHSKLPEDGISEGDVVLGMAISESNANRKIEFGCEWGVKDLSFMVLEVLNEKTIKWEK